jgi:uncharacterized protein YcfL
MTIRIGFVALALLVGCSSSSSSAVPKNRSIVLGDSIAGISLDEPRKSVERAFGHGTSRHRGEVW